MKNRCILFCLLFCISNSIIAQEKEKNIIKPRFELNNFNFIFNSGIYNFSSKYSDHFYQLAEIKPLNLPNTDSSMSHDNIINITAGLNFNKQLFNENSSIYGNLNFNIVFSSGGKIKTIYQHEYTSHADSAILESEPIYNIDSIIVKKNEYTYKSNDIGLDIQYRFGNSPKKTLAFETGLGISLLFPVQSVINFISSDALTVTYTNEYNKNKIIRRLDEIIEHPSHCKQIFIKMYIPVVLSINFTRNEKLSLITYFNCGIDIQHPIKGSYFTYPYFSLGIGLKYKI